MYTIIYYSVDTIIYYINLDIIVCIIILSLSILLVYLYVYKYKKIHELHLLFEYC